jgi:hypothetical protein
LEIYLTQCGTKKMTLPFFRNNTVQYSDVKKYFYMK